MILALDTSRLPQELQAFFEDMQLQMAAQWQIAHTPSARPLRTLLEATQVAGQSIATATWTAVTFDGEADLRGVPGVQGVTAGVHSKTVRPDRFLILPALAGRLRICADVLFDINATGARGVRVAKNGSFANDAITLVGNAGGSALSCIQKVWETTVVAGDEIGIEAYQNSGGSLAIGGRVLLEWL